MTTTVQRVKKVGGSLMVRIPKEIAEIEQIQPDSAVEVEIHRIRKNWFGSLQGLKPLKKSEKLQLHG